MRHAATVLMLIGVAIAPAASRGAAPPPLPAAASPAAAAKFDGNWNILWSCAAYRDAVGYSFSFTTEVKNGVLHGQRGAPGEAGWLSLDGPIRADGTATLQGTGLTGSVGRSTGHAADKTPYSFQLDSRFDTSSGTGTRSAGRPCEARFWR